MTKGRTSEEIAAGFIARRGRRSQMSAVERLLGGRGHGPSPTVEVLEQRCSYLAAQNTRLMERLERARTIAISSTFSFRQRAHALTNDRGNIYAVVLIPEISPFRIKVGHTTRDIGDRVAAFRTTCPTAVVVGGWPASFNDETNLLLALPGRIGESEVFVCGNIDAFLDEIEHWFARRLP